MKNISENMAKFLQNFQSNYWVIATGQVLWQWITVVIPIFLGLWLVQLLFSHPVTTVFEFIPEPVRLLFNKNIYVILKVCICGFALIFVSQVLSWHKQNKDFDFITDVAYDTSKSAEEQLKTCELGINSCEAHKEVLLLKKEMVKSCSPIPVVTALLGYIVEKAGYMNFSWCAYVFLCIILVLIYILFWTGCIRKIEYDQFRIYKWQETKRKIEIKIDNVRNDVSCKAYCIE